MAWIKHPHIDLVKVVPDADVEKWRTAGWVVQKLVGDPGPESVNFGGGEEVKPAKKPAKKPASRTVKKK